MEFEKLYNELLAKVKELEGKIAEFSANEKLLSESNTALSGERDKLAAELNEFRNKALEAEFSTFAEKLIVDKKALPDEKKTIVEKLVTMHKASGAEFSADGSPLALYKAELEARSPKVPAPGHTADLRGAEFSNGNGPKELSERATAYMNEMAGKGITVSAAEAVAHVNRKP